MCSWRARAQQGVLKHLWLPCAQALSRVRLCNPVGCRRPGSSVHGILQARILEWAAMPSSRGSFRPRCPALRVNSLSPEPPGKSVNTEVGSLSLFEAIFLTQELNWGLLNRRQILYQLSYQGIKTPLTSWAIYEDFLTSFWQSTSWNFVF